MREPENSQVTDRLIMAEEVIAEYVQKFGFTVAAQCYFLSWNEEHGANAAPETVNAGSPES
uniref:hypothetical protein n=1 Tax=Roseovarius indicus TaxID=540747 RepID=UPI003B51C8CB